MSNISDFLAGADGGPGSTQEAKYQPNGYIPADGSIYAKATYPELAEVIGDDPYKFDPNSFGRNDAVYTPFYQDYSLSNNWYFNIATNGTGFVRSSGRVIFYSDNGLRWKPVYFIRDNVTYDGYARQIKYVGGKFFAYNIAQPNYNFFTSTDGLSWEQVDTSFTFTDLTFDGTNYLFVNGAGTTSLFGNDLDNLTSGSVGASTYCVEKIGSTYVTWVHNSSSMVNVYISSNGTTWTLQAVGQNLSESYSVTDGKLFIVCYGNDSTTRPLFVSTTNGTSWTSCATTLSRSSSQWRTSYGGVVFDGTNYALGFWHTSTSSRMYYGSDVAGSFTIVTASSTSIDAYRSSMCMAFKPGSPGIFVMDAGSNSSFSVVTSAIPTTSWQKNYANSIPTIVKAHSAIFGSPSDTTANNGKKVMVLGHNTWGSGSAYYQYAVAFEDDEGYFEPYNFSSASYDWFQNWNTSTALSGTKAVIFDNGTQFVVNYWNGSVQYQFYHTVNYTNKTITYTRSTNTSSNQSKWSVGTGGYHIYIQDANTYRDDGSSVVNNTSMSGYGTAWSTMYAASFNKITNVLAMTGVHSTSQYRIKYTTNGGLSWTEVAPQLFDSSGSSVSYSTDLYFAIDLGDIKLVQAGSRWFAGSSFNRLNQIDPPAGLPTRTQNFQLVTIENRNVYLIDGVISQLGSGSQTVTYTHANASNSADSMNLYEFPFGICVTNFNGSSPQSGAYQGKQVYDPAKPVATFFKVPAITPVDILNQVFISTR